MIEIEKDLAAIESSSALGKNTCFIYDDMLVYGYYELCKASRNRAESKEIFDIIERILQITERRDQRMEQYES